MDVTPQELRSSEIREERRGYDRDQTDDLLERAAATIESLSDRLNRLTERVSEAESRVGQGRETEELLQRTLLLAQRTADEAVAEAKARAEQLTREAEERSATMVRDAEVEARRLAEGERRRVEAEVAELAAKRHALATDVDALERFDADYRERLRSAIAADLETLAAREAITPPTRPALHEIDVPEGPEGYATRTTEGALDAGRRADEDEAHIEEASAGDSRATVELDALERAELGLTETSDEGADTQDAVPGSAQGAEIGEEAGAPEAVEALPVDDDADESPESTHERSRRERLFAEEDDEADALDDDAFFASLREAVRDDTPLGPGDDDAVPPSLYDQDEQDDARRFTDVFRRRR